MRKIVLIMLLYIPFMTKAENISVLGIGRLGLCTALIFEKAGYTVVGADINQEYVNKINTKTFNSPEPQVNEYLAASTNFKATTSLKEALDFSDIYFIAVPTPSGRDEAYDHTYLNELLSTINDLRVANKHIVICCTIFPGYIDNIAKKLLKDCLNITVSYNPEFIAQGSIIRDFTHPDVILIGEENAEAGNIIASIYKKTIDNSPPFARMNPSSAEIAKLALNCFVTTKIAYANMIADIADATPGANKNDILHMVGNDSRIGTKCLKPGYGYGGPCFPRDNRALGSYAESVGVTPIVPYAVDQANKMHTLSMSKQLLQQDLPVYIFEDVNYKDNCNVIILNESQKLAVAQELANKGKRVIIKDRKEVIEEVKNKYNDLFEYTINEQKGCS